MNGLQVTAQMDLKDGFLFDNGKIAVLFCFFFSVASKRPLLGLFKTSDIFFVLLSYSFVNQKVWLSQYLMNNCPKMQRGNISIHGKTSLSSTPK